MKKISVKNISMSCIIIISILISFTYSKMTFAQEDKLTIEKSIDSGDLIIASANVKDFGATGNNEIDDTDAFNSAITYVYNMGGGVVFVPDGKYKIDGTILVRESVTLRGQWKNPDNGGVGLGSILYIYGGKDNEQEQSPIFLKTNAAIMDISFYYPEQKIDNVIPYPYTIYSNTHSVTVRNITFYNTYKGISLDGSAQHVYKIYGTALANGIKMDLNYDVSEMTFLTFNSKYWYEYSKHIGMENIDKENLRDYLRQNFIPVKMGKIDDIYLYNLNVPSDECFLGVEARQNPDLPSSPTPNIAYGIFSRINGLSVFREKETNPRFVITDDIDGSNKYSHELAKERFPSKTDVFIVKDSKYGAIGDGTTDDTEAIEKAIIAAGNNGGGTVYFPSGKYVVRKPLTIPVNVELRGTWESAHSAMVLRGSEIHSYVGRDDENGKAFITLNENSGLHGLTIYYPEQKGDNIVPYSWTISGNGNNAWVEYLNIVNPYKAINFYDNRNDGFVLKNMWIGAMKEGISIGGGSENGTLEFITIHYGVWSELEQRVNVLNQSNFTARNLFSFVFGNCKNIKGFSLFNFNGNTSFTFKEQDGGYTKDSTFFRLGADIPAGQTGAHFIQGDGIVIVGLSTGSHKYHTKSEESFTGSVNVFGQNIWGGSNNSIDIEKIKIYMEGGNNNLAYQKRVLVNESNYGTSTLVNGNRFLGYLENNVTEQWEMVIDLEKDENVGSYKIMMANSAGLGEEYNISEYNIYISNDNVNWEIIDSVKDNTSDIVYKSFDKQYTGRYVKLEITPSTLEDEKILLQDFQIFSEKIEITENGNNKKDNMTIYVISFSIVIFIALLIILSAVLIKKSKTNKILESGESK